MYIYIYILYITITIPSPPTYLDNHQSPKWRWQSMYLDNSWAGATNPLLLSVFLHPPGQIRLILTASRGFPWGWSRSPAACPAPPPVPSPRGLSRSPRTTGLDLETQGTRITVTNIIPVVHTLGAQFHNPSTSGWFLKCEFGPPQNASDLENLQSRNLNLRSRIRWKCSARYINSIQF